jgi:hypothetical protein
MFFMATTNTLLDSGYERVPKGKEIVDNRRCWQYVNEKRITGPHKSISQLWSEARALYPNASESPGSRYDNPPINEESIDWS